MMKQTADALPRPAAPSELIPDKTLEPRKLKFAQLLGLALAMAWQRQHGDDQVDRQQEPSSNTRDKDNVR